MRRFGLGIGPGCFTPPAAKKGTLWIDDVQGVLDVEGGEIQDPGFERQTQGDGRPLVAPWSGEGPGGIGVDPSSGRNRSRCGFVHEGKGLGGWSGIVQTVAVTPGTEYVLGAWIETSPTFITGAIGVRTVGGQIIAQESYGQMTSYKEVSVRFKSGTNSSIVVFTGFRSAAGPRGAWIHVDDFSLAPAATTTK
jgi:hypothetical protein